MTSPPPPVQPFDEPLLSVVMPVYKVERYLRAAADSVLEQSYRNLEPALVDDGSPDTCGELYGIFGDAQAHVEGLLAWLDGTDALRHEVKPVAGSDVVRVWQRPQLGSKELYGLAAIEGSLRRIDRRTRRIEDRVAAPPRGVIDRSLRKVQRRVFPG